MMCSLRFALPPFLGMLLLIAPQEPTQAAAQQFLLSDMALGNPDASVTVIEYASMTCPHCAKFHETVFPDLKKEYIDSGKIRFVFRDFPLDRVALRAAMLARCTSQTAYFDVVAALFKSQAAWSRVPDPDQALAQHARLIGIPPDQHERCVASDELQQYVIDSRVRAEREFRIDGTPTFVVDGKTYTGIATLDELREIIDPLLAP